MKYLFIIVMIPLLTAGECCKNKKNAVAPENKEVMNDSIPSCVRKLINEGNKEIPPDAPVHVDEYLYRNRKVYLLTAQCCDQFNMLYDDSCKIICAPSGGFTGRGDGKCTDFGETATYIKRLWENPSK